MSDIARTVVISISPTKAKHNEIVELTFSINPIELAMNAENLAHKREDAPIDTETSTSYSEEDIARMRELLTNPEGDVEKEKL